MGGKIEGGEPQLPPTRARYIKKQALKKKSLAVSFNEKDLMDFVAGFHKRKKKRRKEAQKQQEEALAQAYRAAQKERELALYGGALASDESDEFHEDGEEIEQTAAINGRTEYDNGDMKVTVTTSEISREDEDHQSGKVHATVPILSGDDKKKNNIGTSKKKSFKKVSKHKSRSTPHKRDRKKGNKNSKKR